MSANLDRSGMRSPAADPLGRPRPGRRPHHPEATRVRGGRPIPAHRRTGPAPDRPLRLALWTTAVLTVGTIFGAAAFHVLLVQSQFRLDRLQHEAGAQQQRYEQLRLDVARLAAPERIVAAAQRLGMVVPPDVAYLMAPTPTSSEPASASVAGEWTQVKPHLAARP
jgi:hypothetical protein